MFKLFIADDEQIVVEGIQESICWSEYGVQICGYANNGSEALKKCMIFMPDIIISDIKMPGLNALEFVRDLKVSLPKTQIILISAYQHFEYAKKAIELGVLSYITKPFKKNQILEEVLKACDLIKKEKIKSNIQLELKSKFERKVPILKNYFLNSIIMGEDIDVQEFEENAQLYRLNLGKRNNGVIVLRPEFVGLDYSKTNHSIKEIFTNIETLIFNSLPKVLKIVVFIGYANEIVIIYSSENIMNFDSSEILFCLNELKKTIYYELEVLVSIGVGKMYFDYKNIYVSYKEAVRALNYKLIYGEGAIIYIDYIEKSSGESIKLVSDINKKIECLENAFAIGNCEEAQKKVKDISIYLKKAEGVTYHYVQQVFSQLLSIIVKRSIESNIYNDMMCKNVTDLYDSIYIKKNLDELNSFISDIIKDLCNIMDKKAIDKSSGTINRALEFMKLHCHENIGQTDVAEHVGLNTSYFSRHFKEETGHSFMEYMKNLRIEKAKEYMTSSNMKIYEISEALGYQSVQYFSTLFKTLVGITPQEYKEMNC